MVKINLKYATGAEPIASASHAAKMCYQAEPPEWGSLMDVETNLFRTGHHTTLQHFYLTFEIDGIAIGDITFGLHLASPFYNSDQRSGRFCARMFAEPDYDAIIGYVKTYWPKLSQSAMVEIAYYVRLAVGFYQAKLSQATAKAIEFLKIERPKASEKYFEQNGPKIAQEQLRMVMPVLFPTGFVFTVNLSALVAMYRAAWSPSMRAITTEMAKLTVARYPELAFMFEPEKRRKIDWAPEYSDTGESIAAPRCELINFYAPRGIVPPEPELLNPVDLLHFTPETMDNGVASVVTRVELSTATMGQDQRHRTIGRSSPKFTGRFYLPPILKALNFEIEAEKTMSVWRGLRGSVPDTLHTILAPYGAMVSYVKRGSLNAVLHEQGKRLCWCAQEEIYHLGIALRAALIKTDDSSAKELAEHLEPPCYRSGICAEGKRYCGREMSVRFSGDYFSKRKV